MPRTLEIAIREAVGRRGVSVVVLPGDVAPQAASHAPLPKVGGLLPPQPVVTRASAEVDRLAALLNGEGSVTILCGSGCRGAHEELLALGELLKAPMVHALRGKEYVEWDNPYDVGMTGLIGFSSGYYAMLDCDILLMLGTDFPYRQFYPAGALHGAAAAILGTAFIRLALQLRRASDTNARPAQRLFAFALFAVLLVDAALRPYTGSA